jgi:SAP domain-containing new25
VAEEARCELPFSHTVHKSLSAASFRLWRFLAELAFPSARDQPGKFTRRRRSTEEATRSAHRIFGTKSSLVTAKGVHRESIPVPLSLHPPDHTTNKQCGYIRGVTLERPPLSPSLDAVEFRRWYWLKQELVDFAKQEGLSASGDKPNLANRIALFLGGAEPHAASANTKTLRQTVSTRLPE